MEVKKCAVWVFAVLLLPYLYIHQEGGWNQNARTDLLHALWRDGTVVIDAYHGNTGDKVFVNGHYYSEKAPGISVLALPGFAMTAGILRAMDIDLSSYKAGVALEWVSTALSVSLLTALGGMAFFLFTARLVGVLPAILSTVAVFLGSLPFSYAILLMSHAAVAGMLMLALWILEMFGGSKYSAVVGGLLCGMAIASEYTAVSVVLVLCSIVFVRRGLRVCGVFVLCCALPLSLVLWNNVLVTGSPFEFSYARNSLWIHDQMYGFGFPQLSAARDLLFSMHTGLLFWTPFFLLALPGFPLLYNERRWLFWCVFLVVVFHITLISGYAYWHGGRSFGPRHLTLMLPLLGIAAAYGVKKFPVAGALLAGYSVIMVGLATLVNVTPPTEQTPPLLFYVRAMQHGRFNLNIGKLLGLEGIWSILPLLFCMAILVAIAVYCCMRRSRA